MPTKIYESGTITLIDGTTLYITPLKLKYLRQFMVVFDKIKNSETEDETISLLSEAVTIAMQQYYPSIKTVEDLEDNIDLPTIYKILEYAAEVKIDADNSEKTVKEQATDNETSWEKLDLAEMEAELFLLGIWKDYEELELSLSMPELIATLNSKRNSDYSHKKFLAAIQGVDLDEKVGKKQEDPWEAMKARVFSGGKTNDSNDITALQGYNAQKAGFGIGMGLGYEDLTKQK